MNTIVINSKTYQSAELYAKMHNVSISDVVEKAVSLLLQKIQPKEAYTDTTEFKDALAYVKTLKAKGGKPIPEDENGLDALVEMKYAR